MPLTLKQIIEKFEKLIPLSFQEPWDHSGLQEGSRRQKIKTVLFAYDACREVIRYAVKKKVDLIVTHHPIKMEDYPNVDLDTYEGKLIQEAKNNKIAIYTAHTNHDASKFSLNRYYAKKFGLKNMKPLFREDHLKRAPSGIGSGIHGRLPRSVKAAQIIPRIKKIFRIKKLRFVGDKKQMISTLALCTGSGTGLLSEVILKGIDLFITGDVKYHYAIDAKRHDVCLVDVGHFHSEIKVTVLLKNLFKKLFGSQLQLIEYSGLKDPFVQV